MSFDASTLRKLAALNLSSDQMAGVVGILADMQEAEEARKAAQRDRARKSRASRDRNATVTRRERDVPRAGVAPVEDKTSNLEIEPQKKENIEHAFAGVLSEELSREVIAHRKAIKKPLTAYGAKLLAKQIASCPDPTLAAEAMIANGWQGVKPSYMTDRNQARGSPPKVNPIRAVIANLSDQMEAADANAHPQTGPDRQAPLRLSDYR